MRKPGAVDPARGMSQVLLPKPVLVVKPNSLR